EPEQPRLAPAVVEALEVPVAVPERQLVGIELALFAAVPEGDPAALGDGAEQRRQIVTSGERNRCRGRGCIGCAPEFPERLCSRCSLDADGGCRQMERRQLVTMQSRVGQLVVLP